MEQVDLRYEDLASDEAVALIYYNETKKGNYQLLTEI